MADFYVQNEYWFAVFQLVTAMFGMGATLTIKDFGEVVTEPKPVSICFLIQLVLVPITAYLFIYAFGIAGGVAVGLVIIAAIPGGTSSNMFTFFAHGNIALSIAITAITTIACLASTPFIMDLLISEYMPASFVMPTGQIAREIMFTLLAPLGLGMLLLKYFPKPAPVVSAWCIRASMLGILMIVIGSTIAGRLDAAAFGFNNVLIVCFFIIALHFSAWLVSKLANLSSADSTAIEMEVVVRNVNLGFLIKASIFPAVIGQVDPIGNMVLFTLLLYGGVQLIIGGGIIFVRRQRAAKQSIVN
ncbi:MAG: BASS family bile acid:Na+ symporter [Pseudomonadales bacterium]|jgi:BASS family bile acid:Na+ symporter